MWCTHEVTPINNYLSTWNWGYMWVVCNLKRNILTALIKLTTSQSLCTTRISEVCMCVCVGGGGGGGGGESQAPCSHAIVFQWLCVSASVVWFHHHLWPVPICPYWTFIVTGMHITKYYYPPTSMSILLHYWVYHLPLCFTGFLVPTSFGVELLHSGGL